MKRGKNLCLKLVGKYQGYKKTYTVSYIIHRGFMSINH